MNIVALDTSTEACSVALLADGDIASRYLVEPRVHAKVLLPMLDELMALAQISPTRLDGVAFTRGPGAFTGVRIATAAAQAIALAADIPALPVSTLASIARRAFRENGHKRVAVAIDARMGEVYWGTYENSGEGPLEPKLMGEEIVCRPQSVTVLGEHWIGAGTGWTTYEQELQLVSGASIAETIVPFPHAEDVLAIGEAMYLRNAGIPPEQAIPVYLRDNVARTEKQRAEDS